MNLLDLHNGDEDTHHMLTKHPCQAVLTHPPRQNGGKSAQQPTVIPDSSSRRDGVYGLHSVGMNCPSTTQKAVSSCLRDTLTLVAD